MIPNEDTYEIGCMYGLDYHMYIPLYTYLYVIFMLNVGKYTIHESYGI